MAAGAPRALGRGPSRGPGLPRGARRSGPYAPAASGGPGPGGRVERAASLEGAEAAAARQELFNNVAPAYDELNDLLSLGQHRVWKRAAVQWAGAKPGSACLDVCTGSGDIALLLADAAGPRGSVRALDFASELLGVAAQRERAEPPAVRRRRPGVQWVEGDALAMPFGDASFDCATMGYGLRNVSDRPRALRELWRVLRPGGTAAVLDFNNSEDFFVRGVQGWALDNVVVPVARARGLEAEYEYLKPSIEQFPVGREQRGMAKEAGFQRAVHYELAGGLMGVLVATKAR